MVRPRAEGGQEKPGARTEGGAPVNRPGSVYGSTKGRDRDGNTVMELPSRDANVLIERAPGALGSPAYIGSGDLYGNVADPMSGYWVESLSVTDATASWANLPEETRRQIDQIAKLKWPTATGEGLWEKAVKGSAASNKRGQPMTAFDWIGEYSAGLVGNETGSGGAGTRGVGGSIGPRTSVSMASERDLRNTADAVASTVLGRAVTDEEFQRVLEQVRSAEKSEPTVTTSTGGMTTTQAGLTAEGRQSIIQEALMQGPEAEDFGKATKMMDLFYSALEARPEGA
jgi:hypothetical protein